VYTSDGKIVYTYEVDVTVRFRQT